MLENCIVENIGGINIGKLRLLREGQMAQRFHKFEGENFGDLPKICQFCHVLSDQCFPLAIW